MQAVDSTKLNVQSVAVGLGWDQVGVLVTELDPSHERLAAFREFVELL